MGPVSQENSTLGNFDAASIFPRKFDRLADYGARGVRQFDGILLQRYGAQSSHEEFKGFF